MSEGDTDITRESEIERQEAQGAFERFIVAFSSVDWEPFRAAFADDVTFFFPFLHGRWVPYRANGLSEVEAVFRPFFRDLREKDGASAHIRIEPRDVRIQMLNDIAIVTFHLEDEAGLGRRTIVLQRRQQGWLIVHLHASIVER